MKLCQFCTENPIIELHTFLRSNYWKAILHPNAVRQATTTILLKRHASWFDLAREEFQDGFAMLTTLDAILRQEFRYYQVADFGPTYYKQIEKHMHWTLTPSYTPCNCLNCAQSHVLSSEEKENYYFVSQKIQKHAKDLEKQFLLSLHKTL